MLREDLNNFIAWKKLLKQVMKYWAQDSDVTQIQIHVMIVFTGFTPTKYQ